MGVLRISSRQGDELVQRSFPLDLRDQYEQHVHESGLLSARSDEFRSWIAYSMKADSGQIT